MVLLYACQALRIGAWSVAGVIRLMEHFSEHSLVLQVHAPLRRLYLDPDLRIETKFLVHD